MNGKANEPLIHFTRNLLSQVSLQRSITLEHVKGHSNNHWNDLADHLAKLGNQGKSHLLPSLDTNTTLEEEGRNSPQVRNKRRRHHSSDIDSAIQQQQASDAPT